jgi:glycine cleavage system pyridoxal-binding protein P
MTFFDQFIDRHIGPNASELQEMLTAIGVSSLDQLIDETVPAADATHIEPNSNSTTTSDKEIANDNADCTNVDVTTTPPPAQPDTHNILLSLHTEYGVDPVSEIMKIKY